MKLALLVIAPWPGETAMHADREAMHRALLARGFTPEQIWTLEGGLSRTLLLDFLRAAHAHIAGWGKGSVFLYYTGHGAYWPMDADQPAGVRPAMSLQPDHSDTPDPWVFWDEAVQALDMPRGVHLTLLPDS